MRPFEYVSPNSTSQAISLLGATWGNTEVLAGGTDLLALMKDDVVRPKRIVNIKDVADIRGVSSNAQGLRIGALTTLGELADDENVKKGYPALSEALLEAASPQIRNMATTVLVFPQRVGSVAQRRERQGIGDSWGKTLSRNSGQPGSCEICQPLNRRAHPGCLRSQDSPGRTKGKARPSAGKILRDSEG